MRLQVGAGGVEGRGAQRVDQVDVSAGAEELGNDGLAVGIGHTCKYTYFEVYACIYI